MSRVTLLVQSADPPQSGPGMADLFAAFAGDENAAAGRPFLDSVEIDMARGAREQMADLNLGSAARSYFGQVRGVPRHGGVR